MKIEKNLIGTPGDPRGVFYDLFDADEAAELTVRSDALMNMQQWLAGSGLTQVAAAKLLGVTQARVGSETRQDRHLQLGSVGAPRRACGLAAQIEVHDKVEARCLTLTTGALETHRRMSNQLRTRNSTWHSKTCR